MHDVFSWQVLCAKNKEKNGDDDQAAADTQQAAGQTGENAGD